MRLIFRCWMITAASTLACAATAAEIPISDPDWIKITVEERAQIEADLKASGAIGAEDTIVYKGPAKAAPSQQNPGSGFTGLLTDAGKALVFRKQICKAKTNVETDACSKRPKTERAACRSSERARYAKAKSSC